MPGKLTFSRKSAVAIAGGRNDSAKDFRDVHNLADLEEITLQNALDCLVSRYMDGIFYTYAGSMLVSLNPCVPSARKSLTHVDLMSMFRKYDVSDLEEESAPHVFSVGRKCLASLRKVGNNQILIVSGDSGAGKTTVTQQLLCYFIDKSSRLVEMKTPNTLDKKIYFATLILESLGNASTTSNSNSSRFGRFIQLDYDNASDWIIGAEIRTCLLEKHRVSKSIRNERNFHIFYYVMAGLEKGFLKVSDLLLDHDECADEMLNWRDEVPSQFFNEIEQNDSVQFQSLYQSFQSLKMTKELQKIFRVVYGIMMLNNISFSLVTDEDSSQDNDHDGYPEFVPSDDGLLSKIAMLFSVNSKDLSDTLTSRTITVQGGRNRRQSVFRKPCSSEAECKERTAALTSYLYNALFHHVLIRLNSLFKFSTAQQEFPQSTSTITRKRTLSLLDLYGFENLEANHLEQLCINYANERLQLVHLQTMVNYAGEVSGLEDGFVPTELKKVETESLERLRNIHDTIFLVLNEACVLKRKVSETDTFQRVKNLIVGTAFIEAKNVVQASCPFIIRHYAARVQYTFTGMLDKNSDNIPSEFHDIFKNSKNPFVRSLFDSSDTDEQKVSYETPSRPRREKTLLQKFKVQVDELVAELVNDENQDLHFIRCIRPNDNSGTGKISADVVMRQLFSTGIVDVIRVTGNGYPIRIPQSRFTLSFPAITTRFPSDCTKLADSLNLSATDMRIGQKQIFLSEDIWEFLKRLEILLRNMYARRIQRNWMMELALRKKRLEEAAKCIPIPAAVTVVPESFSQATQVEERETLIKNASNNHVDVAAVKLRPRNSFASKRIMENLNLRMRNGVVTRGQIPENPVRFHVRKTVLEFSHCLPKSQGLNELLLWNRTCRVSF